MATRQVEQFEGSPPDSDHVPLGQKMALGVGGIANTTGTQIFQLLAQPIYNAGLGVDAWLVGLALTIPRFWDAFVDPVMGGVSDNFRSRWGRRRPFIVAGGFLLALSFTAVWMVPRGWGDTAKFAFLLITGILYYTCFSIYSVPLVSLSYEMTPDYHQRTHVMAYWGFFTMAGNFFLALYLPLAMDRRLFTDSLHGAQVLSLIVGGVVFIALGILPGLFVRERFYRAASKQAKVRVLPAILETARSRPMLILLGVILSLALAGTLAAGLAWYIVAYYVCGGDTQLGSWLNAGNGVCFQIVGFGSIPVISWLASRFGKRQALFAILGLSFVGGLAKWLIFTPGILHWSVHVPTFLTATFPGIWIIPAKEISLGGFDLPYLFFLDSVLNGPIWTALAILVPSMMADLCDVDEFEYGKRREGVFGAVFSWMQKFGSSLTFLLAGTVLTLSGFNAKITGPQPESTILSMRLFFVGSSVSAMVAGMAFLTFYNVSEKRAYEVRALLEQRRGKV